MNIPLIGLLGEANEPCLLMLVRIFRNERNWKNSHNFEHRTSVFSVGLIIYGYLQWKGYLALIKQKMSKKTIFLDDNVEDFIKSYNLSLPKRYNYGEVKRITNSFRDKLGHGGYGVVYKASLSDGCQVAQGVKGRWGTIHR